MRYKCGSVLYTELIMNRHSLFSTLLLLFGTHAYLLLPDEGSCYIFSIRNNCCEFLASYGVIFQSDFQPYFKTPVCGAAFSKKLLNVNQKIKNSVSINDICIFFLS